MDTVLHVLGLVGLLIACLLSMATLVVGLSQTAFSQELISKGTWAYRNEKPESVTIDYGTELTAEDVKFTFESIVDPEMNSPKAAPYKQLESIEIIDDYTIKFTLKDIFSPFLIEMVQPILAKQATETQSLVRLAHHPAPVRLASRPVTDTLRAVMNLIYVLTIVFYV